LAYNEILKFVNFLKFHAVLTNYIKLIFFNIWMLVLTIKLHAKVHKIPTDPPFMDTGARVAQ